MAGIHVGQQQGLWSEEIPFERDRIKSSVLAKLSGVYEILQDQEYCCYQGKTRVLRIGMSKTCLSNELCNHEYRHVVANRLYRVLAREEVKVTVRFMSLEPTKSAAEEARLLQEFEDKHWQTPVLNGNRGYARNSDIHYRKSS